MCKTLVPVISILLGGAVAHADEIQLPHITVYGTATSEVTPDQMVWSLDVRSKSLVLADAATAHAKLVADVIEFLRQAGVAEADLQTARMECGVNTEYRKGDWVTEGYYAATVVSFTLRDLDRYKDLWVALTALPGVSVQGIRYDHSKRIEYQNETRVKALLAAREKAAALAKALGSELGEPLLIEEDLSVSEGWESNRVMTNYPSRDSGDDRTREGLALGRIPIRSRVQVAFRLISVRP